MTRPTSRLASAVRALALLAIACVLALLQLSCSTSSLTPAASPMPAARAGLRPEYRVFYDELQEYGDWMLIEPYGFVFRPKTRFNNWSPYYDGFWSPSDSYGWVWVSGEPFGWATYHYGAWINDSYQGYVWVPGLEWAPAWVAWTGNQNYVGWAALTPSGPHRGHLGPPRLRPRRREPVGAGHGGGTAYAGRRRGRLVVATGARLPPGGRIDRRADAHGDAAEGGHARGDHAHPPVRRARPNGAEVGRLEAGAVRLRALTGRRSGSRR